VSGADPAAPLLADTVACHTPEDLRAKLRRGKPLRVKLGVDPSSPDLHLGPQFKTFVDIWNNPKSSMYPPLLPTGAGYAQLADDFDAKWQAGNVSDLQQGLQQLDTNIDNQIQQGETP